MLLHDNSFSNCRHVQQGRLEDYGRLFTDLSGYSLLYNTLSPVIVFDPSTDTRSRGLGFCVYFCVCVLLFVVLVGFFGFF